jgi:FHS family glucose/mannose:H+ symporter-like MFS transporter
MQNTTAPGFLKSLFWPSFIAGYVSMFGFGLLDNGRGPAYPRILEEFGLSAGQGSWFFSLAGLSGVLISLSAPLWLPRFGSFKSLGIANIVFAMGNLCIASGLFIPADFSGQMKVALLFTGAFIFGLGAGGTGICTNMCVGEAGPAQFHKRLYGGLHSLYAISSILGPLVFSAIRTSEHDWRWYFICFSLFPLVTGLHCLLNSRQSPYQWAEPGVKKKNALHASPQAWLIALAVALYVSAEVILSSRLVYFVESAMHYNPKEAAVYLSLFFAGLLSGRIIMFLWTLPGEPVPWILSGLFASGASILVAQKFSPYYFVLTGFFMSIIFPMALTYMAKIFRENFDHMMTMVMNTISLFIMIGHWIFGQISDSHGISWAFAISPIFLVFSIIILAATDRYYSRAK